LGGEAMALYYADVHRAGERLRQRAGEARRHLPKDLRREMYVEALTLASRGLGYRKIVRELRDKYGLAVAKSTISYWVRGIYTPYYRRSPDEERVKIYREALRLHAEGYGCKRIARKLSVSLSTVKDWVAGRCSPYGPQPPELPIPTPRPYPRPRLVELRPCPELAYVIGVVLGDGFCTHTNRSYPIGLRAKDKEFVEEFARCLSIIIRRPLKVGLDKRRLHYVRTSSRELYELLRKPADMERLKPFVEHCEECMAAFLRGFIDSEGHIDSHRVIYVFNTDIELLQYVRELLGVLGIQSTELRLHNEAGSSFRDPNGQDKTWKRRKTVYQFQIRAKCNLTFYQKIGLTIHRKRRRLEEYVLRHTRQTPLPPFPPLF